MHLSLPKRFPLCLFWLPLFASLFSLISALTQGGEGGHCLGSLVQLCCREGGTLQTNTTGMCRECSQCLGHTGFAPAQGMCAFLVYTAQAPGCSAGELSKAGPGLRALSISKPFRFVGTPQWYRLGLACVLCPSQVQPAQVIRCLGSALSPGGAVRLITSPVPAAWFPGCTARVLSQVCCVLLWGADLWM